MDMNSAFAFYYRVYGLTVRSELELPELSPIKPCRCSVSVQFGEVPEQLEDTIEDYEWIAYGKQRCLLRIKRVGKFIVENGRSITIDRRQDRSRLPGCGAPSADVRLFLLGSAFGALLHQRGSLPLHVSAVDSSDGVWAFTGDSGAGKSTLAGWFHRRQGWPMISDDVSVVRPGAGEPLLLPGPRKMKLWEDAVEHLGYADERLVQDLSNTPKFQLYLSDRDTLEPRVLRSLVLLERCDENEAPTLTRLFGVEAFNACMRSVYRPYMADWFRDRSQVLADLVSLCQRIEVYRFRRQWSLEKMEEQLALVFKQIQSTSVVAV